MRGPQLRASRRFWAVAMAIASSGCLTGAAPLDLSDLSIRRAHRFVAHEWPAPVLQGAGADPNWTMEFVPTPAIVQQLAPHRADRSILAVTSDGILLAGAYDRLVRSADAGRTWTPTADGLGVPLDVVVEPKTDRVFVLAATALTCGAIHRSQDRGATWTPAGPLCWEFGALPVLAIGPPGPQTRPRPATTQSNVLYACGTRALFVYPHTIGLGTFCVASFDDGATFGAPGLAFPPGRECFAHHGRPAIAPDGTLALPRGQFGAGCEGPPAIAVTRDSGETWTTVEIPAADTKQAELLPQISIASDGVAYLVYRAPGRGIVMVRSPADLKDWQGPFQVSPESLGMTVFAGIAAGDPGRIAIAFLGTRDEDRPSMTPATARPASLWHLFLAVGPRSTEPSPSFIVHQVTPAEDPIQVGCVAYRLPFIVGSPTDFRGCSNLGTSIRVTSDQAGRAYVAGVDGCPVRTGCAGDVNAVQTQSRDFQLWVAIQDHGPGLVAAAGPLPSLGLRHPEPSLKP